MRKTAQITGKITGLKDLNAPKFSEAEKKLKALGYKVINPHNLCADIHKDAHWKTFMKRCIAELTGIDVLVVLDDWHLSKGGQIEVELACNLGIDVLEIETMQPLSIQFTSVGNYKGKLLNIRL